jgi:hypothetical protein
MNRYGPSYEDMDDHDKEDVFYYLDFVRKSGVTNMYGAGAYIEDEFDVDSRTASKLLAEWMETFEATHMNRE